MALTPTTVEDGKGNHWTGGRMINMDTMGQPTTSRHRLGPFSMWNAFRRMGMDTIDL